MSLALSGAMCEMYAEWMPLQAALVVGGGHFGRLGTAPFGAGVVHVSGLRSPVVVVNLGAV